jgi:hypothetical protein
MGLLFLWPATPAYAQDDEAAPLLWEASAAAAYQDLPFIPGEVLVGWAGAEVTAAQLFSDVAIAAVESLDLRGLESAESTSATTGWRLQVEEGTEWAVIEQLAGSPGILFAVPNWIVYAAGATATQPETPFVVNDRFYADRQWYLQRINASRAWALAMGTLGTGELGTGELGTGELGTGELGTATTAAASSIEVAGLAGERLVQPAIAPVQVAIIDSGVDFSHPELAGRLLPGYN